MVNPFKTLRLAGGGNSCGGAQAHGSQVSASLLRGTELSTGVFGETKSCSGTQWPSSSKVSGARKPFEAHQVFPALACLAAAVGSALVSMLPVAAGPVLCTTSLEAPIVGIREASGAISVPPSPVEVTRCGIVQTPPELLERRAYSWTSPFARGVDMTHQVTDLFGIAMGGGDGTKVMGFGFGDQTLIWDGSAIEHTARVLLEDQSNPMPLRTTDLIGVYDSSLGGSPVPQAPEPSLDSGAYRSATVNRPVRGM